MGGHFHRWRLGCKQSSFGHIMRVLQRTATDAFGKPLLYRHAIVPSRFRVQVSRLIPPRRHNKLARQDCLLSWRTVR